MSVESAWDAELAAAGEAMGDDVERHAGCARELRAEVERLREENAELRRLGEQAFRGWVDTALRRDDW